MRWPVSDLPDLGVERVQLQTMWRLDGLGLGSVNSEGIDMTSFKFNATRTLIGSAALMCLAVGVAQAQVASPPAGGEYGRVISSIAVVQQVAVPKQVCTPGQVIESRQSGGSGAGIAIGAIAGGALGNAVGHGNGRAAATGLGILGGAIVGSMIGSGSNSEARSTPTTCTTQNTFENRTVAFNVVYEYAGKQYSTQMPKDPGGWVPLQVQPIIQGAAPSVPVQAAVTTEYVPSPVISSPVSVAPVYYGEQPVVYAQPAVVYTQPRVVASPVVHISTPIVFGVTRHAHPVTRVVYAPAPVVVVQRGHGHHHGHHNGHHNGYARAVAAAPQVVQVVETRPARRHSYTPVEALPVAAPEVSYKHIKVDRDSRYY